MLWLEIQALILCSTRKNAEDVIEAIRDQTDGGAHVSLDAVGRRSVILDSILGLRKMGRHVQVGLVAGETGPIEVAMEAVIGNELEIVGSHGMQAHRYDLMLEMIRKGELSPDDLIGRRINLESSVEALVSMDRFEHTGVTVINRFS